jgi:hypothetical protein
MLVPLVFAWLGQHAATTSAGLVSSANNHPGRTIRELQMVCDAARWLCVARAFSQLS